MDERCLRPIQRLPVSQPRNLPISFRARVAQWAINVVSFRDSTSIMTPFMYQWDIYQSSYQGWVVDGDPGIPLRRLELWHRVVLQTARCSYHRNTRFSRQAARGFEIGRWPHRRRTDCRLGRQTARRFEQFRSNSNSTRLAVRRAQLHAKSNAPLAPGLVHEDRPAGFRPHIAAIPRIPFGDWSLAKAGLPTRIKAI